jgi:hypothetical protein
MVVLSLVWFCVVLAHHNVPLIEVIAGDAVCVGSLCFGVWILYFRIPRLEKRNRHWCPHCREGFAGYENEVLETGKCHYCGSQVIDTAQQRVPPGPSGS